MPDTLFEGIRQTENANDYLARMIVIEAEIERAVSAETEHDSKGENELLTSKDNTKEEQNQ